MAYDTLSPYAGAYPQTKEELDAQSALTRDVGVGSLRGLTLLTGIADIPAAGEWLARESAGIQTLSSVLPHLDRLDDLDDSDASYLHNLYLRSMGARGDPESQEKAKKLINPLRGEFHNRVEDIIDTIIPFETTERSNIIEYATIMATLGYGIKQIGAMIWRNRKNIPVLLDKMKNAIRKKEDPKAPLQIEHKPVPEARIDKTVERATAEKTPLLPSVRTGYMPSTSGYASPKTKMYHGAKGELPEEFMGFEDYASSTGSVYGGGFYTTSRTGTAKGYAGKKGNLYEITPKKELKLFDMDQSVPPSIKQSIKRGGDYKIKSRGETFEMTDEFLLRTQDFLDDNPKASLVELYDEMRALAPYEGITPGDLEEYFHGFAFILQKAGYKGLRHKGGVLSSRPKKHEVNIYWNPGKDLNIKPVAKADLAAGEKTVERATTGEKAKITRHSRGGLVENKVNYALNQWN